MPALALMNSEVNATIAVAGGGIPSNAVLDENGNPITDENGDYITSE